MKQLLTKLKRVAVAALTMGLVLNVRAATCCRIGDASYDTIAAALATITDNTATTITLTANVTENVTIAVSRTITLDLNGFVLKGSGSTTVVNNPSGSKLTIADTCVPRPRHYFTEGSDNLWIWNNDEETTSLYVDGGLITGGNGSTGGGVYSKGGSVTFTNVTLVGNQSSGYGGGVYAYSTCTINATDCKFLHNYATSEGGGICGRSKAYVTLSNCEIIGNKAKTTGGGVRSYYYNGGSFTASNTIFRENTSVQAGGAIHATTTVKLTDCDITDNTSGASGAVVNTSRAVTLAGTTSVTSNTGGNVYLPSGKVLTVADGFSGTIGVTTATVPTADSPVAITGSCAADQHTRFISDVATNFIANAANNVTTLYLRQPIAVTPTPVTNTTITIYTNDVLVAEDTPGSGTWTIWNDTTAATAVYATDPGYYFGDGSIVSTNGLDLSVNPVINETTPTAPLVLRNPVDYLAPVYKGTDNNPTNGISHWVTNSISLYNVVTASMEQVTWGQSEVTSWYVATNGVYSFGYNIRCLGHVNLILCDDAQLYVTNMGKMVEMGEGNIAAGIATDANGSFTIYGQQKGSGILFAVGESQFAAIGGSRDSFDGRNITINGGRITAIKLEDIDYGYDGTGSDCGAGIGGACFGMGTNIVINGGEVIARSSLDGAGIGGGSGRMGSGIIINGGIVKAYGQAAGIGGGTGSSGSNIIINDGNVTATGGDYAAGIGGGKGGSGSYIKINGGNVTASSSFYGAGIGGGEGGSGSYIEINGGTVTAKGGEEGGTGIGGGGREDWGGGSGSHITINGGIVVANGGLYGAGIGGGCENSGSDITINGGMVTANGDYDAMGIGGGYDGSASGIYIDGVQTVITWNNDDEESVVEHESGEDISGKLSDMHCVQVNPPKVLVYPTSIDNTTPVVYAIGNPAEETSSGSGVWYAWSNLTASVVYTAANGYAYADGFTTTSTIELDTTVNPAVNATEPECVYRAIALNDGVKALDYEGGTWHIVGAGSVTDTANLKKEAITNLVVESGVTGIGANAFDGWRNLKDVYLGTDCTAVGGRSFAKCYGLTNVSCAASVISVGEGAFSRCLGIERLAFAGEQANVSLGTKAVTVRAGIRMEGDAPVVWPIPTVTYGGAEPTLYGKEKLTDATWTAVTDENKANFHFFTYEP